MPSHMPLDLAVPEAVPFVLKPGLRGFLPLKTTCDSFLGDA